MARNRRRLPVGKRRKKSKAAIGKKIRHEAKMRRLRRRRPGRFRDKVTGAYRTVVDTIKDTDRLRNKMEPPGTSETE